MMVRTSIAALCLVCTVGWSHVSSAGGPSSKPTSRKAPSTACDLVIKGHPCVSSRHLVAHWRTLTRQPHFRVASAAVRKEERESWLKSFVAHHILSQKAIKSGLQADTSLKGWARVQDLVKRYKQRWSRSIRVSDKQAWALYQQTHREASFWYLPVSIASYTPPVDPPTPFVLKHWSKANRKKLLRYYQTHRKQFVGPRIVRARHILLRVSRRDSVAKKKAAFKKMEAILQKVRKDPRSFARVAKQVSECPSGVKGGDLGAFAFKRMVRPFSEAAFALKQPGDISPIVKTVFGYHIVQLIKHKKRRFIPFESASLRFAKKLYIEQKRRELLSFVLQWVARFWSKQPKGGTLLARMKAHFANETTRGQTPNAVLSLFEGRFASFPLQQTQLIRRTSYRIEGNRVTFTQADVPGIQGSTLALMQGLFRLSSKQPVLARPFAGETMAYVLRLKKTVAPKRSEFTRYKTLLVRQYQQRVAKAKWSAFVKRLLVTHPWRLSARLAQQMR